MNLLYVAIEVVIAVLSISGNILVCWAVAINTTLKNATNYFLVSLAVADILVGCLAIPFAITISLGLRLDFYGCLFLACFVLVLTQSSIFSLLAIAIDRYLAVKIPLRKQLRQIELKCVGNGDNHHHGLLQKEIRAAKSLSIIVGLFAVCWLPVHILNCVTLFYDLKSEVLLYVAIILSHANSAVNPIIYAYRIQDFRNTFRKILAQHFLCRREELYRSSNGSKRNRDQIHMTIDPLL
ncbi:Adenosine receptor A2b [Nibea albiflora]|uniref:Adenosine receptor A2b n=1 Tax=Nibea albiflora TaxID=240163 RepID=A0ACB7F2U6_NIBAL|nr:Adenosine receptor A2b [Nibea albiflora]